jgi:hypothetical protein
MATQLPAIIQFINSSGDWGVIHEMMSATSVEQAAYEWGQGVERYGISDVHPEGIALAETFMNSGGYQGATIAANAIAKAQQVHAFDQGGWLQPGLTLAYNGTGSPERVGGDTGDIHVHFSVGDTEIAHEVFPKIQQMGMRYASRNNGNASYKGNWAPR